MRNSRKLLIFGAGLLLAAGAAGAQTPAYDPSARLQEVLPADVAQKVLATIAAARAQELPAQALEQRALKFAAKGVEPKAIAKSIAEQANRMEKAKDALDDHGRKPSGDEIEAGAEAMRQGVEGAAVSELAKSAPSGRSLAVPLFVIGTLVDRGLPSDVALTRVLARLQARASDRELETIAGIHPAGTAAGQANRPANAGRPAGAGKPAGVGIGTASRPSGGPPAGVPANAGKGTKPTTGKPKP